ncbi:GNAT family N-acetyltransferase [Jiella pacifica]|uniref:GNAT family N-acetyltransferase n=1 Tax=Jiella pacifica TaxID=2696469 RepID=A0A6N9T5P6_9HYPH|nr:GNAT family N-acetyltransferase [Jiella pacifica]NDW06717.1 GNAT family N-acetyltransferase [Jiella pacifica]
MKTGSQRPGIGERQPEAVRAADLATLLALNNDHAAELSLLDAASFERLLGNAFLARQSTGADAFVVAFDETGDYDSPNFLWFKKRYERFLYIDRVVVAPAARGRGLARALYDSVFAAADSAGIGRVVCEINIDPPNPASLRFHETLGFRQVGGATLYPSGKTVGYHERTL